MATETIIIVQYDPEDCCPDCEVPFEWRPTSCEHHAEDAPCPPGADCPVDRFCPGCRSYR